LQGNLDQNCVAALCRAKARFTGPGRRHAPICLLVSAIDAHEKELGIGRPYLDKDPPHVAPIDGKEYAEKRNAAKAQLAGLKKPSPSSNPK
jgi:hypothetical protein